MKPAHSYLAQWWAFAGYQRGSLGALEQQNGAWSLKTFST